jgi:hypothetical protein
VVQGAGQGNRFLLINPGGTTSLSVINSHVKNLSVINNQFQGQGPTAGGVIQFACSSNSGSLVEGVENILIDNLHSTIAGGTNIASVYFDNDDNTTADCTIELDMANVRIQNTSIGRSPSGETTTLDDRFHCVYASGDGGSGQRCTNTTDAQWGIFGGTGSRNFNPPPSGEVLPVMVNNLVGGERSPDQSIQWLLAADAPAADEVPYGTVVHIIDDTTASGTCAQTTAELDGGSTFDSCCFSDGSVWASCY